MRKIKTLFTLLVVLSALLFNHAFASKLEGAAPDFTLDSRSEERRVVKECRL